MYHLLSREKPTKKIRLTGIVDGFHVEYMATRTKEVLNVYTDSSMSKSVAGFYNNLLVVEDNGESKDIFKYTYTGRRWKDFIHLIGLDENGQPLDNVEHYSNYDLIVRVGTGNTNKLSGEKYHEFQRKKDIAEITSKIGRGNSIEDFLYETRSVAEIVEEKKQEYIDKGSNIDFNLDWVQEKDYKVLVTDEDIYEFLDQLSKTKELVGFDTETTGLLANRTKRDIIVGLSMSFKDHTGYYFPLNHIRIENVHMGAERFLELLKPYIDKKSPKKKPLIGHNIGFDYRVLKMYGIDLNIVEDTYLKFSLVRIGQAKYMGALKAMVEKYLGYPVIELSDMYKSKTAQDIATAKSAVFDHNIYVNPITRYKLERADKFEDIKYDFRFAGYDFVELYGSADADFPRLINQYIETIWDEESEKTYRLEIELIEPLAEQEYYGIRAIREEFDVLEQKTIKRLEELEQMIYAEAGEEFKITSPVDKPRIIFDVIGCPFLPRFKTKKGGRGTDKAVMENLAGYKNEDGTPMYPIISLMQEYSKLSTLLSSFYGKLPNLIHDGYLFPSYKQMGAETGRMSCSNPNLQQTEKTSRKYMTPDSDDYYFLICDYSQVEYRIMAGMSGEQKVVDFFKKNPEADYHILAYANMMNKKYEDVTSAERKVGKTLNFGTTYGLEDANLALKLYGNDTKLHQMMARQARDQYFSGVPILRDYFEKIRDQAQEDGFVRTKYGRRRDIEEFQYTGRISEYKIASGRRKAGNMPVQGTAADLMKMALVRLRETFRRQGWFEDMVRLVGNIHDEVIIQVHKSLNVWYVLKYVRDAMEMDLSLDGFPPLYIGANVGYSWADGKVDELEAPVLLMDEKIAEVTQQIENGVHYTELTTWDDPRTMWDEEIRKFALRQVQKQIVENDLKTLDECFKDGRAMKYVRHFGSHEFNLLQTMLEKRDWKYLWNNLDAIMSEDEIKFKPTVETKSGKGKEIPDDEASVKEVLRQVLKYNAKLNTLRVSIHEPDTDFVNAVEYMLIDDSSTSAFNEDKFYKLEFHMATTNEILPMQYKRLPAFFSKLLKKYCTRHILGIPVGDYKEEIEEVAEPFLK